MVYCDSNLLLRVYAQMPDSEFALQQFARLDALSSPTPITWLHHLEIGNAFEQLVFFARNGHPIRMSPEQASVGLAQFDEEVRLSERFIPGDLTLPDLVRMSRQLSSRHTAKHGFRSYDIVHVASALLLECDAFWSFDAKASKLAALEGLKTISRS